MLNTSQYDTAPIAHGYTIGEVRRIAWRAAWSTRNLWLPVADRADIAWSAIIDTLLTAEAAPGQVDLFIGADRAINEETRFARRQNGLYGDPAKYGGGLSPRYVRYWESTITGRGAQPVEERTIERIAVRQILAALSEYHQTALVTLAIHDRHDLAAATLGLGRSGYTSLLSRARRAARALWHEGEIPSPPWGNDTRRTPGRRHDSAIETARLRRTRETPKEAEPADP